ncbi:MAG: helix-turn-helix transcriptional regulator [Myxococcota bacterium]
MQPAILRRRDVCQVTGLSYSSIWRLELAGRFPSRIRLSPNSVGWRATEVDAWVRDRVRVVAGPEASAAVRP